MKGQNEEFQQEINRLTFLKLIRPTSYSACKPPGVDGKKIAVCSVLAPIIYLLILS